MIDLPDARQKHFTFILLKKRVISVGYNLSFKTHPLAGRYGYRFNNIHSELKAIQNFPYPVSLLPKFTFVNIRIMANGMLGMSKPCKCCQKLLLDFNCTQLWYSTKNPYEPFKKWLLQSS